VPPGAFRQPGSAQQHRGAARREIETLVPTTDLLSSHYAAGVFDVCPRLAYLLSEGRRVEAVRSKAV
jgi:hypothetical protein